MTRRARTTHKPQSHLTNGKITDVSPSEILDKSDPGDDTQRRFRYQHAYGVILIAAAIQESLPYVAIWCEHHEDLLAERQDGLYDAYQLKTQRPEQGLWHLQKDALKDSIKKFAILAQKFPSKINSFAFVSNVDYLDSYAADMIEKSPARLLESVNSVSSSDELEAAAIKAFKRLEEHCECDPETLFTVLKRLKLVRGPGLDSFEAEIVHDHLTSLPQCQGLSVSHLKSLRDDLIFQIYKASSIAIDDPSKHWCGINKEDYRNPRLRSKRVLVHTIVKIIKKNFSTPFRFYPGSGSLDLGRASDNTSRLHKKMTRGGIEDQFETMHLRSIAAEYHLMELAVSQPSRLNITLDQIVNIVKGECDEARLHASLHTNNFGPLMLADVFNRLRNIAQNRPEMVEHQTYECLIGVAGLLTGECKVWWSAPFELEYVS